MLAFQGTDSQLPTKEDIQAAKQQRSKNAIPVIAFMSADADASALRQTDLDGIALAPALLPSLAQSFGKSQASATDAQVQAVLEAVLASPEIMHPETDTKHKSGKLLITVKELFPIAIDAQCQAVLVAVLASPEITRPETSKDHKSGGHLIKSHSLVTLQCLGVYCAYCIVKTRS